jgi:hypothetical protein
MVKLGGGGGAVTTSATVVEWTNAPSAPVIVKVYVPAGVAVVVLTVRVELPEPPVIDEGTKLALAPVGNPLTLRLTVSVKPPLGVIVAVYEVPLPAWTVCEAGVAVMEKSPTIGAVTTSETEAVWVNVPSVPVIVNG